jgi:hypothetical protein
VVSGSHVGGSVGVAVGRAVGGGVGTWSDSGRRQPVNGGESGRIGSIVLVVSSHGKVCAKGRDLGSG